MTLFFLENSKSKRQHKEDCLNFFTRAFESAEPARQIPKFLHLRSFRFPHFPRDGNKRVCIYLTQQKDVTLFSFAAGLSVRK